MDAQNAPTGCFWLTSFGTNLVCQKSTKRKKQPHKRMLIIAANAVTVDTDLGFGSCHHHCYSVALLHCSNHGFKRRIENEVSINLRKELSFINNNFIYSYMMSPRHSRLSFKQMAYKGFV